MSNGKCRERGGYGSAKVPPKFSVECEPEERGLQPWEECSSTAVARINLCHLQAVYCADVYLFTAGSSVFSGAQESTQQRKAQSPDTQPESHPKSKQSQEPE